MRGSGVWPTLSRRSALAALAHRDPVNPDESGGPVAVPAAPDNTFVRRSFWDRGVVLFRETIPKWSRRTSLLAVWGKRLLARTNNHYQCANSRGRSSLVWFPICSVSVV